MYLTIKDFDRACALADVNAERDRQEVKWGQQNHGDHLWNAILGEEVGEVAKSLNENDTTEHLIEELIQVAAVCVSWVEAIGRRPVTPARRELTAMQRSRVFEAVGAATSCWKNLGGAGEFDVNRALCIGDELVALFEEALNG